MNMHTPTQYGCIASEYRLPDDKWRPTIGIFITNPDDEVLIGLDSRFQNRVARKTGWIIPQGGIDNGETPFEAAKREAYEEARLKLQNLWFVKQYPAWLTYDPWKTGYSPDGRLGSQLRWFHFRTDSFNLPTPDMEEFVAFEWMGANSVVASTHACRHEMYRQIIREFLPNYPLLF